jgi:hypothetical protein
MLTWKDETSYSQGTKPEQRIPRTWVCAPVSSLRITVTRYRGIDGWVMHCHSIGIQTRRLESIELADAKVEALGIVRRQLAHWVTALGEDGQRGS